MVVRAKQPLAMGHAQRQFLHGAAQDVLGADLAHLGV